MTKPTAPASNTTTPVTKHVYRPPQILSREPLESVAALCSPPGKADPGTCPQGPISS